MPQMTTILSGATSLAVLAGIVSGIFYLVITGLRWAGRLRAALQEEEVRRQNGIPTGSCVICGRPPDTLKTGLDPVGCSDCGGNACKGDGCSRRSSIGWRCVLCHVKRDLKKTSGNWFNQKTSPEAIEPAENEKNIDSETIQVREFIEKLVEVIVGGPLDKVTVGKLSTHSDYKHGCDFDSPSSAHAALKHLIEKIVNEAMTLPNLKEALYSSSNGIVNEEEDFTNKSYEDILATAILNKVIERFQQQNGRRYETIDKNSNLVTDSNCGGSGRSGSAHDDDLQSNSDWSDTSRTEPLSLTIEEHIEEVTTTYESSDEDDRRDITQVDTELKVNRRVPFPESGRVILDGTDEEENSDSDELHSSATELVTSTNTWEENWLFQKKRLRSTPSAHHPVPVPMLVPNPSQEFRALIGGVDADDLSDMSECSDSVLEDIVMADKDVEDPELSKQIVDALNDDTESSQNELDNSKSEQIIIENHENPKEQISDSQVVGGESEVKSEESGGSKINGYADTDEEVLNGELTPPDSLNSESSPQSLSQKDRECSVDYESVHQIDVPVPKTPIPKPRTLDLINNEKPVSEKPPKCPIAEREKEKWKHAIELPNNPYSPENIAKRIQNRKNEYFRTGFGSMETIDFPDDIKDDLSKDETDSPRYSRDYYVKASKSPTGDPSFRSSSSISQLSESSEEVSGYFANESQVSKTNVFPHHNAFSTLKKLSASHRHFSKVFQTAKPSAIKSYKIKLDEKYQYGTRSLRLPGKSIYPNLFSSQENFEIGNNNKYNKDLIDIEQKALHDDVKHIIFRARGASPNFMLNPVFENDANQFADSDPIKPTYREKPDLRQIWEDRFDNKNLQLGQESGYGSTDSSDCWRLTPPKKPEMLESSFEPVLKQRKIKNKSGTIGRFSNYAATNFHNFCM